MVIVGRPLNEGSMTPIMWGEFCNILRGYGNSGNFKISFLDGSSVDYLVMQGRMEYHFMGTQIISFKGDNFIYRLKQDKVSSVEQVPGVDVFYIYLKNRTTCKIVIG